MSYNIVPFDKSYSQPWNEFLTKSKNGVFLFDRNYMDYHDERFGDESLMIYKGNKIISIFPANRNEKIIYSHQGLTYGGLIFGEDLKAVEVIKILHLIIEYYRSGNCEMIIYKSIPFIFHKYPADEDLYALMRYNSTLFRRDIFSVVDISNPIKFSETKGQSVRKCVKNNVSVIENDEFEEYWQLLTAVLERHGATPVHSKEEIKLLKNRFPQNIRLFEARKEQELLAGIVIYDYGNVIHTQYMANSDAGRSIGALDFINHNLITEKYKDRKYYSFGSSTENQGKFLNEGLIQQKELMGGRAVVHDFYQIEL